MHYSDKTKVFLLLIALNLVLFSCDNKSYFDKDVAKNAILELHHAQRDYHFKKDSLAFANQLSSNFISVNRGEITTPKHDATVARYHSYFSSVEFNKWDDLAEPIIKFSDDGSLAYTIVDKIVEVEYLDEKGANATSATHFAWTTIYKKYDEGWKIDCVTSTQVSEP